MRKVNKRNIISRKKRSFAPIFFSIKGAVSGRDRLARIEVSIRVAIPHRRVTSGDFEVFETPTSVTPWSSVN